MHIKRHQKALQQKKEFLDVCWISSLVWTIHKLTDVFWSTTLWLLKGFLRPDSLFDVGLLTRCKSRPSKEQHCLPCLEWSFWTCFAMHWFLMDHWWTGHLSCAHGLHQRLQPVSKDGQTVSFKGNVNPVTDTAPPAGLVLISDNRIPAQPHHTGTCMSSPSLLWRWSPWQLFSLQTLRLVNLWTQKSSKNLSWEGKKNIFGDATSSALQDYGHVLYKNHQIPKRWAAYQSKAVTGELPVYNLLEYQTSSL